MRAMVLEHVPAPAAEGAARLGQGALVAAGPLVLRDAPSPRPGPHDMLIRVMACGVCRTELDQVEGRIAPPRLPVVPGHQPVGVVAEVGSSVTRFRPGDMAGATWLFSSCGACRFCRRGNENLCESFRATGCHADGGYAEYMAIPEAFAARIPPALRDFAQTAPLMCAGAVGYRSLRLADVEDGMTLGLYGFGSANHLVLQMAAFQFPRARKYVFSRNAVERGLALELGAEWAGNFDATPPTRVHCAIDTTPAWGPVLKALEDLEPGGRLVINAIRKEAGDQERLLSLDYARHLWLEKEVKSVANVTRSDGEEALALAARAKIAPVVEEYRLEQANQALADLKAGRIRGSKVLVM